MIIVNVPFSTAGIVEQGVGVGLVDPVIGEPVACPSFQLLRVVPPDLKHSLPVSVYAGLHSLRDMGGPVGLSGTRERVCVAGIG